MNEKNYENVKAIKEAIDEVHTPTWLLCGHGDVADLRVLIQSEPAAAAAAILRLLAERDDLRDTRERHISDVVTVAQRHLDAVAERDKLRTALMDVCNNATDGHCAGAVTTEFLLSVPAEAAKCYARLKAERDAAIAQLKCKGCGGTVGDHLAPDQGGCPARFEIDGIGMLPIAHRDAERARADGLAAELAKLHDRIEKSHNGYNETGKSLGMERPASHLIALGELLTEQVELADSVTRMERDEARADLAAAQAKQAALLKAAKCVDAYAKPYEPEDLLDPGFKPTLAILRDAIAAAEQGGAP